MNVYAVTVKVKDGGVQDTFVVAADLVKVNEALNGYFGEYRWTLSGLSQLNDGETVLIKD